MKSAIKKIIFLVIFINFLIPNFLIADESSFKVIKPGMSFYELGLNNKGQIIYQNKILVKGKFDETSSTLVPFTDLGVYKPYNGVIFFYANGLDDADHGFFNTKTDALEFKYPCCKWFQAKPLGYSKDGRYIFSFDNVETWPVIQIIDLKSQNYFDFQGDFDKYNLSVDKNGFYDVKLENFKVDDTNNFSYDISDVPSNKTFNFRGKISDYKVLNSESYKVDEKNIPSGANILTNNGVVNTTQAPGIENDDHSFRYRDIFIPVICLIVLVTLLKIRKKN